MRAMPRGIRWVHSPRRDADSVLFVFFSWYWDSFIGAGAADIFARLVFLLHQSSFWPIYTPASWNLHSLRALQGFPVSFPGYIRVVGGQWDPAFFYHYCLWNLPVGSRRAIRLLFNWETNDERRIIDNSNI